MGMFLSNIHENDCLNLYSIILTIREAVKDDLYFNKLEVLPGFRSIVSIEYCSIAPMKNLKTTKSIKYQKATMKKVIVTLEPIRY